MNHLDILLGALEKSQGTDQKVYVKSFSFLRHTHTNTQIFPLTTHYDKQGYLVVKVIHSTFGVMFIGQPSYFPYKFQCETRKCEQLYEFHISPGVIVRMNEICQNLGFISLVKN